MARAPLALAYAVALGMCCLPVARCTTTTMPCNVSTSIYSEFINSQINKFMIRGMDDATWVLTSSFVILTMQSGFGSLESGSVDKKFEVNVMMKNVIDVVFGGLSYWMIGYGISYGETWQGLLGTNKFFVNMVPTVRELVEADPDGRFVDQFSHYMFQFTFASTATTIVSGCVAGRMKFTSYIIFSFINTIVYSFPCHWAWADGGVLNKMGYTDFAGDGPVHLMGGVNGLIGAIMVGHRPGRFDPSKKDEFGLQNPLSCIFGLFMLWWGWLGFNCGSTYGVSGDKWLVAARVAVTTINSSIGGGVFGVFWSYYMRHKGLVDVESVINGILAALVGITGGCAVMSPISAIVVGVTSAFLCLRVNEALYVHRLVDDPVGAFGVHGVAAMWGLIAIGFLADSNLVGTSEDDKSGVLHGGGFELLGIQCVGIVVIVAWTTITSWIVFKVMDRLIGIRADEQHIQEGFDSAEHGCSVPEWIAELEANTGLEDHLPAMAKQIESLRIEVLEARSAFEAQQWELEALRRKHDCSATSENVFDVGAEETDAT